MTTDWFLIWAVVVRSAFMCFWTYAYLRFPAAIDRVLEGQNLGPFARHLVGVKNFVRYCGHAHWVMALADLGMLALMYLHHPAAYLVGLAVNVAALVPLYRGGVLSVRVVEALRHDAGSINRFIQAAQRGLQRGTLATARR